MGLGRGGRVEGFDGDGEVMISCREGSLLVEGRGDEEKRGGGVDVLAMSGGRRVVAVSLDAMTYHCGVEGELPIERCRLQGRLL